MQVTDAMVAAALKRAGELEGGHPERWIHRETMREALQAALDAAGHDVHVPVRIHVQVDEPAFKAAVAAAVEALPGVLPRDEQGRVTIATLDDDLAPRTGGRVWQHTSKTHATDVGQFHNEGGDFLPGPKRIRTGASPNDKPEEPTMPDDATKQPAPGFGASAPSALGSFTFPLDDRSAASLLNPDQIAEHLDVTVTQVDDWIRLGPSIRFPEPFKWVSGIPQWQLAVIDQWYGLWKGSNGG